jgi:predicted phosphoadenosine phosphosulfate sulfurtransferase
VIENGFVYISWYPESARDLVGSAKADAADIARRVNIPSWRDPAVLLISQLKEIYIDAELDVICRMPTTANGLGPPLRDS